MFNDWLVVELNSIEVKHKSTPLAIMLTDDKPQNPSQDLLTKVFACLFTDSLNHKIDETPWPPHEKDHSLTTFNVFLPTLRLKELTKLSYTLKIKTLSFPYPILWE